MTCLVLVQRPLLCSLLLRVALSLSEEPHVFYAMYRQCSIVFIFVDFSILEVY